MEDETKQCPYCGEDILAVAKKCKHCGEFLESNAAENSSPKPVAQIQHKPLPPELQRFNWGAFCWAWIWGLAYKKYITLIFIPISFIPFVNSACLGLCIWFGLAGNQWAWEAEEWQSVAEFNRVQKLWVIWWLAILAVVLVLSIIVCIIIFAAAAATGY